MRILVVDDDRGLTDFLKEALSGEGYAVDAAYTGEEGKSLAESIHYDLIIPDILLPGKNGVEVCQSLRQKKIRTPVIMLSGERVGDQDIIQGLDCGADEYLLKPVTSGVLSARIRALLRKEYDTKNIQLKIGNLILDTVYKQVWQGQKEIILTKKEYAILEYLAYHTNMVITRTELEQHAWNFKVNIGSNVVYEHIKNLRKKLGSGVPIETIRGVGYRLKA